MTVNTPQFNLSGNYDIGSIANRTGARDTRWWRYRVWPRAQPSPGHVTPLDEKVLRRPARPPDDHTPEETDLPDEVNNRPYPASRNTTL